MSDGLTSARGLDLDSLVAAIADVHVRMQERASRAVNVSLTLRNWIIGAYIAEYELRGDDRAGYGERVFDAVAERLAERGLERTSARELRRFKHFYETYPQIWESLTPEFADLLPGDRRNIRETASPKFGDDTPYALASMNNQLFVSRYEPLLPSRAEMATFLEEKMAMLASEVALGDEE